MAKLNEFGQEICDPEPVEVPAFVSPAQNLMDQVRLLIQQELSRAAQAEGLESFEEADDFEVGDDYDPRSPYELTADQEEWPAEDFAPTAPRPGAPPADPSDPSDSGQA